MFKLHLGFADSLNTFSLSKGLLVGAEIRWPSQRSPNVAIHVIWCLLQSKTAEKLGNLFFSRNLFFHTFKLYLGGLGVSGGMAWTIQSDSLELWLGLVLHGMGEIDLHGFWKYWKLTSSPILVEIQDMYR